MSFLAVSGPVRRAAHVVCQVLLAIVGVSVAQGASSVTLAWDPSPSPGIAGYRLYRGSASHNYTNTQDVGLATTNTVNGLVNLAVYFFAVSAYDTNGLESALSSELAFTNGTPANAAPTLNAIANLTVLEDSGQATVSLSGISSGSSNETQTLTVTAVSSAPTIIPDPTVSYSSPGITGTLTFKPVGNAFGTATITVTVNDGQTQNNTISRSFTVTVTPVNDPPTLNALANITINEDAPTQVIALSGISSGAANETQTLTMTATSSNPSLIPTPVISYSSPNASGTLSFTSVANAYGSATITVTVNDGQAQNNTISRSFVVTVNPVNHPPTLNALAAVNIGLNAGPQTVALSGITSGAANEAQALTVSASSSNPGLIPAPSVSYASPNTTGSLTFTPVANAFGVATITVTVNDGQAQNATVSRSFTVTVNDPPFISQLADQTLALNSSTSPLAFTVGDAETAATNLEVYATSSTPTLVPTNNIVFGGSESNRTVTITPVSAQSGASLITLYVSDGLAVSSTSFQLLVQSGRPGNTAPAISAVGDQNTQPGAPLNNITFTVNDAETAADNLLVTASSSDQVLLPNSNLILGGSGASRSLSASPAAGLSGSATVTLTVSDGAATATSSFKVNVFASVVMVQPNGGGTVQSAVPMQSMKAGYLYTVSAVPNAGQVFAGWSGSITSALSSITFRAKTNLLLQANFVPLTLRTNGSGSLWPNLAALKTLVAGRWTTVWALPNAGQVFAGWTGSSTSSLQKLVFLMSTNTVVQANFVPLTLRTNGSGYLWPNLGAAKNLIAGQWTTVWAVPNAGQVFAGWTGSYTSSVQKLVFRMSTNTVLEANFVPNPWLAIAGYYSGLFYEPGQVRQYSSGSYTFTVTGRGTYSGYFQIGLKRYVASGYLDLQRRASAQAWCLGSPSLGVQLAFNLSDRGPQLSGTLTGNNWTATITGERAAWGVVAQPVPWAGTYTLRLPGQSADSSSPAGDSMGYVSINRAGVVSLSAILGDNTRFTLSSLLSQNGMWPLYAPLYSGQGSMLSWLTVSNLAASDISGDLSWIKPATPSYYYPAGFTNDLVATGWKYQVPTGTNAILQLPTASLAFSGGNILTNFANSITIAPYSRVTNLSSNGLTMGFLLPWGMFSGNVVDPSTKKVSSFYGMVSQKLNAGFGTMFGTNQTSRVLLAP